jgi:myo-inositol-1(or 4)-monophosphatase
MAQPFEEAIGHKLMKNLEFLTELLTGAGNILLRTFGKASGIRQKESASSVVCDADVASEEFILRRIRRHFPDAGVIAEESGRAQGSDVVFVVDPLDGTSNYVAGLPWFGVQVGVLEKGEPTWAGMYLPVERTLYLGEKGKGVWRNGKRITVTTETRLPKVLCAFGMDSAANEASRKRDADLLTRVAGGVRNVRTTNSLYDFCYTLEGKLGACVNLNCKIWDIVPVALMLPEAGGKFTYLSGQPIRFESDQAGFGRSYQIIGAGTTLHRKLLRLVRGV